MDHFFENREILKNVLSSAGLITLFFLAKFTVNRLLKKNDRLTVETRRRWIVNTRGLLVLSLMVGLAFIWAVELRTLALSVVALAVALVVGTKELILCVCGSFLRTVTREFSLGDRIEIDGVRGDVIDQNLLSTTILEIGPGTFTHQYTGRTVSIPNSTFLTNNLVNESFTQDYVLHVFTIPTNRSDNWQEAERILLQAAEAECLGYAKDARYHFAELGKSQGLETPSLEPRVLVHLADPETINLVLRICVPARRKGRIEQAILRRFLDPNHWGSASDAG